MVFPAAAAPPGDFRLLPGATSCSRPLPAASVRIYSLQPLLAVSGFHQPPTRSQLLPASRIGGHILLGAAIDTWLLPLLRLPERCASASVSKPFPGAAGSHWPLAAAADRSQLFSAAAASRSQPLTAATAVPGSTGNFRQPWRFPTPSSSQWLPGKRTPPAAPRYACLLPAAHLFASDPNRTYLTIAKTFNSRRNNLANVFVYFVQSAPAHVLMAIVSKLRVHFKVRVGGVLFKESSADVRTLSWT